MIERPGSRDSRDRKLEQQSAELKELTPEKLEDALALVHTIFPSIAPIAESPDIALPASLEPEKYKERLDEWGISSLKYWLAEDSGVPVGITGLYTKTDDPNDTAWVGWYGVAPEARGKGLGRKIIENTIDKARAQGTKQLKLYTTSEDDPIAHALYEKLGFAVTERETAPEGYEVMYLSKRLDDKSLRRPLIERLLAKSKYIRGDPSNSNTDIESTEGQRFSLKSIERRDDPDLKETHKLLQAIFKQDEVISLESLEQRVEVRQESGAQLQIAKSEEGQIAAVFMGYRTIIEGQESALAGKNVLAVAYAATHPDYRKKGLARELYISTVMKAQQDAEKAGKDISLATGECTHTSEQFWNDVGWKRVYFVSDEEDKKLTECKYYQPPVEYDPKTGGAAKGFSEVPEHLMVDRFDRDIQPTKEEISAIGALWLEFYKEPRDSFDTDEAYANHEAVIAKYTENFQEQLADAKRIVLLDARRRNLLNDRGWTIDEHTEADGPSETGPEDF